MRLIFSRKGFDSGAGGCPSPIFPDGSMLSLPIPDKTSPVRYTDVAWRGRDVGRIVETLTKGRRRATHGAHLDPDLRESARPRHPEWRPSLGQINAAQGHLVNQGVTAGDLFLFWGLFREVDADLRWMGPRKHVIWGWLQIDSVASIDEDVRRQPERWQWLGDHPHLHFPPSASNTLYVSADRLRLPGEATPPIRGAGAFESFALSRCLTRADAARPSAWLLPRAFLPQGRPPLSFHSRPDRWQPRGEDVLLDAVARGQEFVLDLDHYPEVCTWLAQLFEDARR